MIYPRITSINGRGKLVDNNQMVTYKEHMTQNHRVLFMDGTLTGDFDGHNLLMTLDTLCQEPINLLITSGGGSLDAAFLFYDTMKLVRSPIYTIGRYCASAAALLLAAGTKRYLFPHSKVMLHLPAGEMRGDSKDIKIQHEQMEDYQDKVVSLLTECGVTKSRDEILEDIDRDFWLDPEEAIKYGLADEIMTSAIWETICQQ